jgi:hypothetical protein
MYVNAGCPTFRGLRLLQNSCRPLIQTRFVPLSLSRHCCAGLPDAAATRLKQAGGPPKSSFGLSGERRREEMHK